MKFSREVWVFLTVFFGCIAFSFTSVMFNVADNKQMANLYADIACIVMFVCGGAMMTKPVLDTLKHMSQVLFRKSD